MAIYDIYGPLSPTKSDPKKRGPSDPHTTSAQCSGPSSTKEQSEADSPCIAGALQLWHLLEAALDHAAATIATSVGGDLVGDPSGTNCVEHRKTLVFYWAIGGDILHMGGGLIWFSAAEMQRLGEALGTRIWTPV